MPIFEFYCKKCQHKFEELILKSDELNSIKCPRCKDGNLERLFSSFSFSSDGRFSSNTGLSCTECAKPSCAGCSK